MVDIDVTVALTKPLCSESSDTNNLNNNTHYGYSLQELRDKDMSLGDLFGNEHPEGFLVIRYKDDKKWLQQHREHQELRAERARAELLSNESDTNESGEFFSEHYSRCI